MVGELEWCLFLGRGRPAALGPPDLRQQDLGLFRSGSWTPSCGAGRAVGRGVVLSGVLHLMSVSTMLLPCLWGTRDMISLGTGFSC